MKLSIDKTKQMSQKWTTTEKPRDEAMKKSHAEEAKMVQALVFEPTEVIAP